MMIEREKVTPEQWIEVAQYMLSRRAITNGIRGAVDILKTCQSPVLGPLIGKGIIGVAAMQIADQFPDFIDLEGFEADIAKILEQPSESPAKPPTAFNQALHVWRNEQALAQLKEVTGFEDDSGVWQDGDTKYMRWVNAAVDYLQGKRDREL